MISREVMKKREAEFEAAQTRAEIDALEERWQREDTAIERASLEQNSATTVALRDLHRRTRRLERFFERDRKTGSTAFEDVLAELVVVIVADMIEARQLLTYGGVWDEERMYPAGTVVTCAGSLWIATAEAKAGHRPGKAACWNLAAKNGIRETTSA